MSGLRRVVLDTSTLVSAALRVGSLPHQALLKALGTCEICVSSATLDEDRSSSITDQTVDLIISQFGSCQRRAFCRRGAPVFKSGQRFATLTPRVELFSHVLRRHNESRRTPMPRNADRLAQDGVQKLPEAVLGFDGGYRYH